MLDKERSFARIRILLRGVVFAQVQRPASLALVLFFALALDAGNLSAAPATLATAGVSSAGKPAADAGETIFRRGIQGSGQALVATRDGGVQLQGAAAACINCHRPSGLGAKAGRDTIPPITGRYLFHPRAKDMEDLDLPYVDGIRADRDPYTDETIARAIRSGLNSEGKPLSYLMPQFALNDADMAALIAYLKRLDQRRPRGVADTVLHFATIITPDADPVKRRGMLDVLQQYFTDKNVFPLGATPPLRTSRRMMFMVNRRWQLHVWELTGPSDGWEQQLKQHLAAEPVFAVLSGLGGKTWAPIHAFCEDEAIPCLFPNVETPVGGDSDFYSLYLSKGVLLEAELIAKKILGADGTGRGRAVKSVRQIYRAGDSGEAAAQALAAALKQHGIAVSSRVVRPDENVAKALKGAARTDALVMWLRPADIAALAAAPAPKASTAVFMSGLMGGLEHAPLPPSWRSSTSLAYPVDLPERRRYRVDYAFGWFAIRHIPVVAEQVQADTYLACGLLAETLSHMVDTFVGDYLVERIEDMLERRILTGYYPRLTLASGQRFASKGGYIVRFAEPDGVRLVAEGDWIVP
ncbi:c-type cytochrome [Collimonas humicola]|uniref:c-type cytochrome n=1 Tax=Collimonas humicola TaxID=2825886 RepID=UPI001B8C9043|nr:cytochrome c [Collimonas humicola]